MDVIERVRERLEKDGRTVQEIADAAGIGRVFLSRFKHGQQSMGVETFLRLADAVGLTVVVKPKGRQGGK